MNSIKLKKIEAFLKDESGATAIEYSMIAALISVIFIGAVASIGTNVLNLFTTLDSQM
jgi:pilus assembly protein Flp/PilA